MAKAKRQPRGLGRSAAAEPEAATENARHNPIARPGKETSTDENKATDQDQDMTDATESQEQETASLALQGEAGDEMAELRQTYEAAQKQFAESGTQEYLRGTIHECDRMLRNCGEEVYPSSEFNYIYASALHDFSQIGAEAEELNGFVEMALEHISHAAELLDKTKDSEWAWKYYLVAGKVHLQKADSLYEEQEAAGSKKQFEKLGKELHSELVQAKNFLETGFSTIPEGEEKHVVRLDAKSIEKVLAKPHEMISAAANVALHADRFEDYERRKMWNTWALETYQKVAADSPDNVEAWQGIATCLHSIVGWWADQADEDEDEEEDEEEEEEPEDEYSLPVYSTERGQFSFNALEAIKKAIVLARKSDALTSDLLTLGAECHLNLVNIAVGDKAAAEQSKEAVALIKEAIATFPDPAIEERYAEVLAEFEEIAGN
ncbi:hypothetical protein BG006_007217 [Podila minutissima]|uniref:Uncharacterized protein n=1 Tax=Podila minutissima TaxID=64525 RepID=A0A9P5SSG3_9FUNG|nr:hypothetical protein BG006_007217 [Podila minutissima]